MAMFIAMRIIDGAIDYDTIFGFKIYQRYRPEVDKILIERGHGDLVHSE